MQPENNIAKKEAAAKAEKKEYVHQCKHCLSVYDETIGEPEMELLQVQHLKNCRKDIVVLCVKRR